MTNKKAKTPTPPAKREQVSIAKPLSYKDLLRQIRLAPSTIFEITALPNDRPDINSFGKLAADMLLQTGISKVKTREDAVIVNE